MKLSFNLIFITILVLIPVSTWAQAETEAISQFRRTVFQLQQEMLELKNQIDSQNRELRAQREELGLQVERLNQENAKMKKHLLEMDSLIFQMEDRLASSSLMKLSKELQSLRNFNQAMVLDNINQVDQSEKLLLDILNQPESSLPKDLLILLLAQQKKRHQLYDDSISYYSTLLSEFSDSTYFSQAIYEMSEIFGETDKQEQQITLLAQLSSLSEIDPYSLKASEKLKELGAEELFEEDVIKPDATGDIPAKETALPLPDTTSDSTNNIQIGPDVTGDSTSDIQIEPDSTSDIQIIPDVTGDIQQVEAAPIATQADSTPDADNNTDKQIKTQESPATIQSPSEKSAEEIKKPESGENPVNQMLQETSSSESDSESTADTPGNDES